MKAVIESVLSDVCSRGEEQDDSVLRLFLSAGEVRHQPAVCSLHRRRLRPEEVLTLSHVYSLVIYWP